MTNHVHLVFRSINGQNPELLVGDLKRFTSRSVVKSIQENPKESRREFLLDFFKKEADKSSNVKNYQFWRHDNKPIELWSNKVIQQKIDYVHNNPVEEGLVYKAPNISYLHRDYQGTILAITDASAIVMEKRLFDAWGSIIKVEDKNGKTLAGLTFLDRGYTGHEHLQSVGLINMNARLYDPMLHRFLQVDNYIQDPTNTQNYNQYGYVLNNPLLYTDPSGNASQGSGGDCKGCGIGIGPGDQTGTSFDLAQFAKDYGIDKWMNKNRNFKNWGKSINKWFGGGSKGSGLPSNMSSYVNLNNASFTGGQLGMNNFNSSLTHDIYRITPNTSLDLSTTDWEKVAGKTNQLATSGSIIAAGLEATGRAAPYMLKGGKWVGNIGTIAQVADNSIKVYKGVENGGISRQKFGFRMIGTVSSWGIGSAISSWGVGGSMAGPAGVFVAVIIGAGFQGIEYTYDIIAPQIQSSYNGFVNNLYSASYNAQFSGR